jgi:hypothetical protein
MKQRDGQGSEFKRAATERTGELIINGPDWLLEQYREMADDFPQEAEAEEWSEALIGDSSAEE